MNGHTQYDSTSTEQISGTPLPNEQVGSGLLDDDDCLDGDPTLVDPDAHAEDPTLHFKYTAENQTCLAAALLHDPELLGLAVGLVVFIPALLSTSPIGCWSGPQSNITLNTRRCHQKRSIGSKSPIKSRKRRRESIMRRHSMRCPISLAFYPPDYWKHMLGKFAKLANFHYSLHKFAQGAVKGVDVDELHQQFCERYEQLNAVCVSDEQLESLDAIEFLTSLKNSKRNGS